MIRYSVGSLKAFKRFWDTNIDMLPTHRPDTQTVGVISVAWLQLMKLYTTTSALSETDTGTICTRSMGLSMSPTEYRNGINDILKCSDVVYAMGHVDVVETMNTIRHKLSLSGLQGGCNTDRDTTLEVSITHRTEVICTLRLHICIEDELTPKQKKEAVHPPGSNDGRKFFLLSVRV